MDSFFRKRQLNLNAEEDYEYLKQLILVEPSSTDTVCLQESDLLQLKNGESAFLLESPLATSAEEAAAMAERIGTEIAPEPGHVILFCILQVITDSSSSLETVQQTASQIFASLPQDINLMFTVRFCEEQKGIRFVLAASEGTSGGN